MSNAAITARLFDAVREDRMAHAVLLAGHEGSGAYGIARRAAALHCCAADDEASLAFCPDYKEYGPAAVPVDDIRALRLWLAERSFSGRRAIVFREAHNMKQQAQNALLKSLEEPFPGALFLLTGQEAGLLPTIRSRCMIVRLGPEEEGEVEAQLLALGVSPACAALFAWLCEGAPELAQALATQAHEDYFHRAAELFFTALTAPIPPYDALSALLDTALAADKDARSKAAKQRPGADFLLRVWRALARDMLTCALKMGACERNPYAHKVEEMALRFTTGEIQGMIEQVLTASLRLKTANPSLTMDSLLARMEFNR